MTYEQYKEQREALMNEAQALIDGGRIAEAEAKHGEVTALDSKWNETAKAIANQSALTGAAKTVALENKGLNVPGLCTVETTAPENKGGADAYLNAWCAHMQGRAMGESEQAAFDKVNREFRNAYTHDTGNTAVLIPETVAAGIWKRAGELYPLYADAKKYAVQGKLTIKKHTGITEGDAAWYDEDTATADEKNAFGELVLDGCELSKAVTVSWKLRSMAMNEFIPFIVNELGERMGVALGNAAATGKGKPGTGETFKAQPQGVETALLAESGAPQVVSYDPETSDPLTYVKLTAAIGKIHSSYLSGAAIYANNATIWGQLSNLLDGQGRPLFIPDVTSGGVGRMFGMVVKPDAGVTDGSVIIGKPYDGMVFNVNEPVSISTEEHAKARTVDYVAYAIVDGGVLDTKAFALIRNTPEA